MKVLHLLQSDRFSGAENVVCQIIGIIKDEPNIDMVYSSRNGQIAESLRERNIDYAPIQELSMKEVKRIIREQKPDIIHAHDMRAGFVAALVCGRIPLVSHIHRNLQGLSLRSIAYYYVALKARHIFWVSKSSFEGYIFHNSLKKKSTVLYNIIDVDALYKKMRLDSNIYNYDVVYVGRLTYQKNPQRLIKVLQKVCARQPNIKIAIVGTGDLEEETKNASENFDMQNNVQFLGFQNNPLKMLQDSKTMIMTSRFEGTPMCALEALALGTPVISTPTDGLCELVINGRNGFLSNDDDVLANKIVDVVTNDEVRKKLSEQAIILSKEHNDIPKYKKKIMEVYASLY